MKNSDHCNGEGAAILTVIAEHAAYAVVAGDVGRYVATLYNQPVVGAPCFKPAHDAAHILGRRAFADDRIDIAVGYRDYTRAVAV